jgi:hypothetical protein
MSTTIFAASKQQLVAVTMTVVALNMKLVNCEYHGILINGQFGTQLYDPFNAPNAQGNLFLGLPTGTNALGGAAVIKSRFAYFGGGNNGVE